MNKFTLNLTDELIAILEKARKARHDYDRVMQETRGDILNPHARLSSEDLNKRNEAARIRAHAMQNLGEYVNHLHELLNPTNEEMI